MKKFKDSEGQHKGKELQGRSSRAVPMAPTILWKGTKYYTQRISEWLPIPSKAMLKLLNKRREHVNQTIQVPGT